MPHNRAPLPARPHPGAWRAYQISLGEHNRHHKVCRLRAALFCGARWLSSISDHSPHNSRNGFGSTGKKVGNPALDLSHSKTTHKKRRADRTACVCFVGARKSYKLVLLLGGVGRSNYRRRPIIACSGGVFSRVTTAAHKVD